MARSGRQVEAFARSEPDAAGLAPLGADLEGHGAGQDAHRLLLPAVVLEAQRLAGAHVEDLADVAVGARPDGLVPPGLGDVLGPDRARGSWRSSLLPAVDHGLPGSRVAGPSVKLAPV